jgi:hypothetical protein
MRVRGRLMTNWTFRFMLKLEGQAKYDYKKIYYLDRYSNKRRWDDITLAALEVLKEMGSKDNG